MFWETRGAAIDRRISETDRAIMRHWVVLERLESSGRNTVEIRRALAALLGTLAIFERDRRTFISDGV